MDTTIILSDLHLGSGVCQAKELHDFLSDIHKTSNRLILNGDVFDSMDFRRLKKHHWQVLSILRKISDKIDVRWNLGNHEKSAYTDAETISHLLGIPVMDDYEFESNNKKVLVLHGHIFDEFLDNHPVLSFIGDIAYGFFQWIDKSHKLARLAKHNSKYYLRCEETIREKTIKLAIKRKCQIVCVGHSHNATEYYKDGVHYLNSGCWTERPAHYIQITDGEAKVVTHELLQAIP